MYTTAATTIDTSTTLSDEKLYELCKQYGERALLWRRKFAGLLPEVNRRRLYEKKKFSSIFEFAAKLCGMSKEQVARVLNIELKFQDKPILKKILVEGKVSANKLVRIVSVATVENQEFLANQVQILPKSAVETLVKDIKLANVTTMKSETQNGLFEPINEGKSVPGHTSKITDSIRILKLGISHEVIEKLSELQNKGIDINELILEFLKTREEEIELEKFEIAEELARKHENQIALSDATNKGLTNKSRAKRPNEARKNRPTNTRKKSKISHYISVKIHKILHREHGTKCSIPGCNKPAKETHHTDRISISQTSNPFFLAPLCREHHLIAHSVDQKFHEKRRGGR